ncbi:MAG TPA: 23S rRNA (guanosine(2251)-2'-O)-methyltransferase RlmB [Verrucomicrobiae bacterium]|jgi:23S rRNA (guanosine2251-2'-O)-methyltransferase|nr:23S rRNA (guanosine(2251)-2'-O)-methyltransferase RlmB [Verrucomicrobiae bacterium]
MENQVKPLVICGVNAVAEKLKSAPAEVLELIVAADRERARLNPLIEEARRNGLSVRFVGSRELGVLTAGASHQGVAATVAPYGYGSIDDLLEKIKSHPSRILVLDGITDPHNFGALLRSAEGAGVAHVVIAKDRAAGITPAVVKSSAGAVNHLKIYRVTNIARVLQELKRQAIWIAGLDGAAPETIYDREYPEALAIVVGSEGKGMRPLIRQQCDFLVSIPMLGKVASLNVSVAAGVFLYELARQLRSPGARKL